MKPSPSPLRRRWILAGAALAFSAAAALRAADAVKPARPWEAAIQAFEAADRAAPPPKGGILFLGSSSIAKWNVGKSFPDLPVLNRGFGGSQVADSVAYADRILIPYAPRLVVFYAGDNDIAAGKSPSQVSEDFQALAKKALDALPETRMIFIGIKPSLQRWGLVDKMREANRLIKGYIEKEPRLAFLDVEPSMLGADGKPRPELFLPDGLHLNEEGYKVWSGLLRPMLDGHKGPVK